MCGRYSLTVTTGLDERFNAEYPDEEIRPRYNIAPSQNTIIIPQSSPDKMVVSKWGLPVSWIKDRPDGMINVRIETLKQKPYFHKLLDGGRCLVIADGFYEWKKEKDGKTPYRIALKKNEPFAFAGVFKAEDKQLRFAILTTKPNSIMKPIHSRMPVILEKKEEKDWLHGNAVKAISDALSEFPAKLLEAYAVSKLVNSPINDNATIIRPAARTLTQRAA